MQNNERMPGIRINCSRITLRLLSLLAGFLPILGSSAAALAEPCLDSEDKPALPRYQPVSPSDVWGNASTCALEQKLLAQAQSASADITSKESFSERITAQMKELIDTLDDPEQLERLAYWAIKADLGKLDEDKLEYLESVFSLAVSALKKKFPSEARARIYELACLVQSDGHISEEIEAQLMDGTAKLPVWSFCCCYVYILQKGRYPQRYDATTGSASFNLTRILRQKWHKHWSGTPRHFLACSFKLLPDGRIKNLKFEKVQTTPAAEAEPNQDFLSNVRQIISCSAPYTAISGIKQALPVEVQFSD